MQFKGRLFECIENELTVENGKITAIGEERKGETLDFGENMVLPGFIDVHTHRAMGKDTMDCTDTAMQVMKKHIADHGVTEATHLFNCMSAFTHRAPGVVGATLEHPAVFAVIICDGIHVSAAAAKIAMRAKGSDKMILISDSMRAAGMPDGL